MLRNRRGDGTTIYTREDIAIKLLAKYCLPKDIEVLFVDTGFYHPLSRTDQYLSDNIDEVSDYYSIYKRINYYIFNSRVIKILIIRVA